jgi:DNA polymerase III subunit epsilon
MRMSRLFPGGMPGRRGHRSVPGWSAMDRPWRQAEFVVLDFETTGLHLKRDEVVSYGAVLVRSGRIVVGSRVYGLVRPTRAVSQESAAVHGLVAADLREAPGPQTAAKELADLLIDRVLVAHAAWVEFAFLRRIFLASGIRLDGPVVDTASLSRAVGLSDRLAESEPRLEALAEALGLPVHTPHHALGDALTTAGVFLALATRLDRPEPQTVRSLQALSRRHSAVDR